MDNKLINIGFGNAIKVNRILAVVHPGSSPIRKLKEEARKDKKLIDVTEGRRTRAIVILDTGHLVLSSVQPETISQRFSVRADEQKNPGRVFADNQEEKRD